MNNLTISHRVPRDLSSPKIPCIWCGRPTTTMALTPFRPDLGALPLMLTCGAHMRIVYKIIQNGGSLDSWEMEAIHRLAALPKPPDSLGSGA